MDNLAVPLGDVVIDDDRLKPQPGQKPAPWPHWQHYSWFHCDRDKLAPSNG